MQIDVRGLSCPQPVVEAKNAVKTGADTIEILLDNATSIANVTRYMTTHGYTRDASETQADGSTRLTFKK